MRILPVRSVLFVLVFMLVFVLLLFLLDFVWLVGPQVLTGHCRHRRGSHGRGGGKRGTERRTCNINHFTINYRQLQRNLCFEFNWKKKWKLHYINPKGTFILSPQKQHRDLGLMLFVCVCKCVCMFLLLCIVCVNLYLCECLCELVFFLYTSGTFFSALLVNHWFLANPFLQISTQLFILLVFVPINFLFLPIKI